MFPHLSDRVKAAVFYALAFILGVALIPLSSVFGALTTVVMATPLVAVLLMLLVVTRDGYGKAGWAVLGLGRTGVRAWGLALLIPLLVLGFGYSVVWLMGIASITPPPGGLATLPVNLAVSVLIALPLVFGEEIGWRGYLLPHLAFLGQRRALLLSGLLHGVWHLPILLFTPHYHNVGNRLLVAALFLATLTVAGVVYGYLRLTTNSMWPAVLAHSAGNAIWGTLDALSVTSSPLALEYLAGESGLLPLLALVAIAAWTLRMLGREPRVAQRRAAPRVGANA